jgi:hypothetical protein
LSPGNGKAAELLVIDDSTEGEHLDQLVKGADSSDAGEINKKAKIASEREIVFIVA